MYRSLSAYTYKITDKLTFQIQLRAKDYIGNHSNITQLEALVRFLRQEALLWNSVNPKCTSKNRIENVITHRNLRVHRTTIEILLTIDPVKHHSSKRRTLITSQTPRARYDENSTSSFEPAEDSMHILRGGPRSIQMHSVPNPRRKKRESVSSKRLPEMLETQPRREIMQTRTQDKVQILQTEPLRNNLQQSTSGRRETNEERRLTTGQRRQRPSSPVDCPRLGRIPQCSTALPHSH